ncbi:MAG TPA: hypothetical protein PLK67_04240 [Bryobacteraceae bacterium]|nr:hypothetical protein [Bryobacteraceae bacterium]
MSRVGLPVPIIRLSEWKSRCVEGLTLGPEDRALAAQICGPKSRQLQIDELRAGLRISARSWVGVVRFPSFELQIVPKLAGRNVGLVKLIDFTSGLDCLRRFAAVQEFESKGSSLFDLIALLHAEACEAIARGGLLADYREVEEDLPVVRGRLMVARQYLRRFGQVNRVECRYDEQVTDVPENQLLLAALVQAARKVANPAVQLRIRRLVNVFASACSLDGVDLREIRTGLAYDRLNGHYRTAHDLSWLILDGLGVRDLFGGGDRECFAFLLDMNRLFESFVCRWLSRLLTGTGLQLTSQYHANSILWDADRGKPYAHIRPDILVHAIGQRGKALPIDAKYKLYDEKGLSLGDVYQTFLYAFAWGSRDRHAMPPRAMLIHPSSSPSGTSVRLHVRDHAGAIGGELVSIGIHIPTALEEAMSNQPGPVGRGILRQVGPCFA